MITNELNDTRTKPDGTAMRQKRPRSTDEAGATSVGARATNSQDQTPSRGHSTTDVPGWQEGKLEEETEGNIERHR